MSTPISKFNSAVLLLSAAPAAAIALFSVLLVLGVPPATRWFWPEPATNAAEAAVLGDAARLRALAARGDRLDAPLPIGVALDEDAEPTMTPLEAAVRRRGEDSLVPVLLDLGVRPPRGEQERLYCLARRLDAGNAALLLDAAFDLATVRCDR